MKPEDAVARAEELVTRERLEQMARSYAVARWELDHFQEIVSAGIPDRLALRIAIRKLAGTI